MAKMVIEKTSKIVNVDLTAMEVLAAIRSVAKELQETTSPADMVEHLDRLDDLVPAYAEAQGGAPPPEREGPGGRR